MKDNAKMIRAIMICDYNNPVSVAYSKIAMATWKDVKNVEVERWQCYTPATIDTAPFKINWGKYSSAGKYIRDKHEITPTEKACLTSMFHWWKHIADTGERVIILEHDAYVRDPKELSNLVKIMPEFDLWNPGIAMECASLSPYFAKYCMKKWLKIEEQVDAGPMAELWTAMEEWIKVVAMYGNKLENQICADLGVPARNKIMWPTIFSNNTIGIGNFIMDVLKGKVDMRTAPVTQVYCPGKNTLVHHSKLGGIGYGDNTYRQMEIIDDLKAEAKKVG